MTFTAAQKDSIRKYLGISTLDTDGKALVDAQTSALTTASSDAETRVIAWLTELSTIEGSIATERAVVGGALNQLKSEAIRFVNAIANELQIRPDANFFLASGSREIEV